MALKLIFPGFWRNQILDQDFFCQKLSTDQDRADKIC